MSQDRREFHHRMVVWFCITAAFLMAPQLHGDTLEVGAGAPYASIQAAVDDAQAGDTILLHPGTYNELVDIDTRLQITSSGGADVTFCTTPINWEDIFDITADSVEVSGDKFLRM